MPTNKKIFLAIAILFTALMLFFAIDFGSRTTRPGAKKQLIERVGDKLSSDSTKIDTLK